MSDETVKAYNVTLTAIDPARSTADVNNIETIKLVDVIDYGSDDLYHIFHKGDGSIYYHSTSLILKIDVQPATPSSEIEE